MYIFEMPKIESCF